MKIVFIIDHVTIPGTEILIIHIDREIIRGHHTGTLTTKTNTQYQI